MPRYGLGCAGLPPGCHPLLLLEQNGAAERPSHSLLAT